MLILWCHHRFGPKVLNQVCLFNLIKMCTCGLVSVKCIWQSDSQTDCTCVFRCSFFLIHLCSYYWLFDCCCNRALKYSVWIVKICFFYLYSYICYVSTKLDTTVDINSTTNLIFLFTLLLVKNRLQIHYMLHQVHTSSKRFELNRLNS